MTTTTAGCTLSHTPRICMIKNSDCLPFLFCHMSSVSFSREGREGTKHKMKAKQGVPHINLNEHLQLELGKIFASTFHKREKTYFEKDILFIVLPVFKIR